MVKSKNPVSAKPPSGEEGASIPDEKLSPDGLDLDALKALREEIEANRATDCDLDKLREQKLGMMSLRALVAYMACDNGVNEEVIFAMVYDHFGVSNLSQIHESDQEKARRFLVDLDLKAVKKAIN